jgi:hypothetical protein
VKLAEDDLLPTAKDVLAGIEPSAKERGALTSPPEQEYVRRFQNESIKSQLEYAHLSGTQDHYLHKGKWSWFLMAAVGGMLVFQSVLLWQVGIGHLDFTKYKWLLPALLVQNLGQVIGLAVYAVRYLFSDINK